MNRYTIHSFETDPNNRYTDLSAFFNTPGVADPHLVNQSWVLIEVGYSLNMAGWSGTVNAEGALVPGSSTPPNLVFYEQYNYPGDMEIQVIYRDPPPCPDPPACPAPPPCLVPPPPWPYAGGGGSGTGGGCGSCGA